MANEKKERYCELLIVQADGRGYVVKAPTQEVYTGDLVEFDTGSECRMGIVEDKMWCVVGEEQYRCMSLMNPIHTLKKVYHNCWTLENEPDWETE